MSSYPVSRLRLLIYFFCVCCPAPSRMLHRPPVVSKLLLAYSAPSQKPFCACYYVSQHSNGSWSHYTVFKVLRSRFRLTSVPLSATAWLLYLPTQQMSSLFSKFFQLCFFLRFSPVYLPFFAFFAPFSLFPVLYISFFVPFRNDLLSFFRNSAKEPSARQSLLERTASLNIFGRKAGCSALSRFYQRERKDSAEGLRSRSLLSPFFIL